MNVSLQTRSGRNDARGIPDKRNASAAGKVRDSEATD